VADLDGDLAALERLARENPGIVVAVGEIGLDYYWKDVAPEEQKPRLARQLDLARKLGLPVVFHCRDALADLLAALEAEPALPPGVFHCFSGGPGEAERALAMGFHVSFAGNVTYPKAKDLQEALRAVPVERLLLETDCPFLAPQPCRGRRNEPAFVRHTCEFLARAKGVAPAEMEAATDAAARRLFRIPASMGP
jgi:TatD DNase family protein